MGEARVMSLHWGVGKFYNLQRNTLEFIAQKTITITLVKMFLVLLREQSDFRNMSHKFMFVT